MAFGIQRSHYGLAIIGVYPSAGRLEELKSPSTSDLSAYSVYGDSVAAVL